MDYKIKFEAKGMGQRSSGIRQRVFQSQKSAVSKAGKTASSGRETISSLRILNSSIMKLIASNKDLAKAVSGGARGASGGHGGRDFQRRPEGRDTGRLNKLLRGVSSATRGVTGVGAGIARIGASIPVLGAGIAALGFSIQKINQIGNAYIQQTAQQIGSVGVGGFRTGRGVYTGAQLGAGAKAYGMATGQFQTEVKSVRTSQYRSESQMQGWGQTAKEEQRRLNRRAWRNRLVGKGLTKSPGQIGAIFGLSAEQAYGTAGRLQRAGANYGQAAAVSAGMGVQTEIPMLLQGMEEILTSAVREGVNTSDMSKDMAKEISVLTMKTPGKSVEAALNMVRSSQAVQKDVSQGRMKSVQGLFMAKTAQKMLMQGLTGANQEEFVKRFNLSGDEAKRVLALNKGSSFEDLQRAVPGGGMYMLKKYMAEMNPALLQRKTMESVSGEFGQSPAGRRAALDFMETTGWSGNRSQWETQLRPEKLSRIEMSQRLSAQSRGEGILSVREKGVTQGQAGISIARINERQNLILQYGDSFAKASRMMERAMLQTAQKLAGPVTKGLNVALSKIEEKTKGLYE